MNRFPRAGENGALLTDCRELSPNHTAAASSSSSSSSCSDADRYAALPSLQTRGPVGSGGGSCGLEQRRSTQKSSRAGRERKGEAEERSAAAVAVRGGGGGGGGDDVCAFGKRQPQQQRLQEAQGRGAGLEMISAVSRDVDSCGNVGNNSLVPDITASPAGCPKSKEERKGKNVIRGWKRERDRDAAAPPAPPLRTRKEKSCDGSSPPPPSVFLPEHHPCRSGLCPCAAPDCRIMGDNGNVNNNNNCGSAGGGAASKATLDCGVKSGGAIVVRRQHDDTPAAKKHRGAEKVRGILLLARNTGITKHTRASRRQLLHMRHLCDSKV